jgi:thiol-disulfide isomerase/thioredoxin
MKTLYIFVILLLTSFTSFAQNHKRIKIKKGAWISHLSLSDSDVLPFEMKISKKRGDYTFTVINGDEQIILNTPEQKGDSLIVRFPFFNSALRFTMDNKKCLTGHWYNYNKGADYKIPLSARKRRASRFISTHKADSYIDVNGRWQVEFEPNTNSSYPAVGVFKQKETNTVSGTFLTETGDYRYLAGNTTKDSLYLSCFDGSHAFLFKAKKDGEKLSGKFFSGNHWQSEWVASPNPNFELTNPDSLTYLVDEKPLTFSLKDLEGNQFTFPNGDYKNKVTIIQIMGSWCPNCLDETQYYKTLYDKYHDSGLEIISIGYETGASFDDHANNLKRLQEKLDLNFKFIVGGSAQKNLASEHFNMLNEVVSFPTSIFIGRDGMIKRVHTGFNGPGTGVYYTDYIQKTNALVESLLAK